MFICPLCGLESDASARVCAPECPLKTSCSFMSCPRCGYQVVDVAHVASRFMQRVWNKYEGCLARPVTYTYAQN